MSPPLKVYLHARELLAEAGLRTHILASHSLEIEQCPSEAEVAILASPSLDERLQQQVQQLRDLGCDRIVVVVKALEQEDVGPFIELRVSGLILEEDASPPQLAQAASDVAQGGAHLPPRTAQCVLALVQDPQLRRDLLKPAVAARFDEREEAVVRLLAEGYDTYQIAEELHFSERTIKGVVHRIITKFGLRNRSHVVAYALRRGLI
jgi:DNA-binding NarL/FixJ family response regulator